MAGFTDRLEAGRLLGEILRDRGVDEGVVLGLARGGVEVGYAVASTLGLPLRALIVRKLGAPQNPELALGAVSETGVQWLDPSIVQGTNASQEYVEAETERQIAEARRRQEQYNVGSGLDSVLGKQAIVVDDGIATGASSLVAVESARGLGASRVILATPVASAQSLWMLKPAADLVIALEVPEPFLAVGYHFANFNQVTDEDVVRYLHLANEQNR
jgi:putative phosphoribosyl transferase